MKAATLDRLQDLRAQDRAFALVSDLAGGAECLVVDGKIDGDLGLGDDALAAIETALTADRSTTIDDGGRRLFVRAFHPPMRLIVVGAVHIAEPLVQIAALAGYAVSLIDPRRAFAARESFAGLDVSDAWPDEALSRLAADRRAAVVTLTHDPKLDDAALGAALASPAFYIGALGSRKTHAARLARLRALGFGEEALARIHGPVGLAIGAVSPPEIAIAIMAEITAERRRPHGS